MVGVVRDIWKVVDRITDMDISQSVQDSEVDNYLESNYYIVPEDEWDEIQTRGYDIELMMSDADEKHSDDTDWIDAVFESLVEQGSILNSFWRGYPAGTNVSDIYIEELGLVGNTIA